MTKKSYKVVFRKGRTIEKVVVLVAVVVIMAVLLSMRQAIISTEARTEELRQQAVELEQENSRLEQYIAQLGTVQGIIRAAQEELGLVDPDSIVFNPEQ